MRTGDAAALHAFDQTYLSQVPSFIARLDPSPAFADEVKQVLRTHLLLARDDEQRPRIADYSGRGALGGWLRVAAVRAVHRLKDRKLDRAPSQDALVTRLVAAEPNPEVALMRARHGADLARAVKLAIAELSPRDRNLVKLHIVEGMTMDQLCGLYDVHRATVARWIVSIKEQLFVAATRNLKSALGINSDEVESLCAAVRSQLDVSLNGLA